jgi:rhodanese-related sulfurtransferase
MLFPCKGQSNNGLKALKDIAGLDSTLIIDVRTPKEYQGGHIEKSVNIPLDVIADSTEQVKSYASLIVVCRSGKRSAAAKKILEEKGFTNVYDGGAWDALDKLMREDE